MTITLYSGKIMVTEIDDEINASIKIIDRGDQRPDWNIIEHNWIRRNSSRVSPSDNYMG